MTAPQPPVQAIPTPLAFHFEPMVLAMQVADGEEIKTLENPFVEMTMATVVGVLQWYLHPAQAAAEGGRLRAAGKQAATMTSTSGLITPPSGLIVPGR